MKRIALALALFLAPGVAWAQCSGVFANNTVCGNATGSSTTPRATSFTSFTGGITALTGDVTATGPGSVAATLATVNSNVGAFGSSTSCVTYTVNGKGLITASSAGTCTPAIGSVTGLGTGVATALAINTGTAGSHIVNGGALGTPTSGTINTTAVTFNLNGVAASTAPAMNAALNVSAGVVKTTGVNFNSANTDNAIVIPALPTGYTRVRISAVQISNADHTLVTATFGVFPATGGAGTAIISAGTAITVSATADATANNAQVVAGISTVSYLVSGLSPANTIQFRVGTAEGAAATADVSIFYSIVP